MYRYIYMCIYTSIYIYIYYEYNRRLVLWLRIFKRWLLLETDKFFLGKHKQIANSYVFTKISFKTKPLIAYVSICFCIYDAKSYTKFSLLSYIFWCQFDGSIKGFFFFGKNDKKLKNKKREKKNKNFWSIKNLFFFLLGVCLFSLPK